VGARAADLTAGRESVISDLGDGRILRRGGRPAHEAELMSHAAAHGITVPKVLEVHDDALVLERIEGPTMDQAVRERPWTVTSQAKILAELHRRIAAASLCHFDLHPANVILSATGPVVIDWTNGTRDGDPAIDAALTYIILATSCGLSGRVIAHLFKRNIDIRSGLENAAEYRLADRNVRDSERASVQRLVRRLS
jgi:tRNA A-37 threonylcarbamoyl transferase component Bud32